MLYLRKLAERLSFAGIFVYGIFLSGGCEPNPKMISYGSNEYSQLEFDGTNFEHQPLLENYNQVWAGERFSLAMFGGPGMGSPSLICKGDSTLGQCELPDTMIMIMSSPYNFTDLKLGFNHGLLSYAPWEGYGMNPPQIPGPGKHLIAWGDSTYGQNQVPALSDSTSILMTAVGGNHNIIVVDDGELTQIISWGDNTYGQCDVPMRFNPVVDSIKIVSIDAGSKHTIVAYDSSGIIKIAAWGDNEYGQINVPPQESLTDDLRLLDIRSGYNHNFAILYDETIDYSNLLLEGIIVDTLFTIAAPDSGTNISIHPVTIIAWGDNSYGQLEIPQIDGLLESWDAGGYHNSLGVARDWIIGAVQLGTDPYTGETYEQTVPLSSGREIVAWGKNDFGQTHFPIEYRIEFESYTNEGPGGPGGGFMLWQNPPPQIALGDNHTLISSRNLYRSPMLDYTFPDQFQGSYGDTIYQSITFKNIGPDTVFIDSIYFIYSGYNYSEDTHPFYFTEIEEEFILFGDSVSFDLYCVYDSAHAINANGTFYVEHRGWFDEMLTFPVSSFFGPQVRLSSLDNFIGNIGEIATQSLTIYNNGTETVYLDSLFIPYPFSYEPFEENSINEGDSLIIDLFTTLEDLPAWNQANGTLYISNFNTLNYNINLTSMRYLEVGDHLNYGFWMLNRNHQNCNSYPGNWDFSDPDGMFNNLNFYNVPEFYTNVHHFDFGYTSSDNREFYSERLDSLYSMYRENSYFVSLLGLGSDLNSLLPWPGNLEQSCDSLSMNFQNNDVPVFYQDQFSDYVFEDWVESVIVDQSGIITYIDTFNLESLQIEIESQISLCGYDCLPDNAINLQTDTIEVSVQLGDAVVDTLHLENITEHTIDYSLEVQSGVSVAKALSFTATNDQFWIPSAGDPMNLSPPFTISFWFKPIGGNWTSDGNPTKFIYPSEQAFDPTNFWRIILANDQGNYPRIGWMDQDVYWLATTPIFESEWYHIAFVIDVDGLNLNLKIYVNGNEEIDELLPGNISPFNNLRINENNSQDFTGFLSQTASWSTALNENDIELISNLGIDTDLRNVDDSFTSIPDLFFYYTMEAGYGSFVEDRSENNYHAAKFGNYDSWYTEIVQTGIPWLNTIGGETGSIYANDSRSIFFYANSDGLNIGSYIGQFNLYPDHNEYVVENAVVILNVVEELSLSSNNIPTNYALHQNYPNPFNPITKIQYNLPEANDVKINIYDIRGILVKSLVNQQQEPGFKSVQWNALNDFGEKVSSGMYFYEIETPHFKQTKKMILLK